MALENAVLATFNRGIVDPRALARVDIKRIAMAAETQTNWLPRSLGSMIFRPGTEYIGSTYNNTKARHIPFIKATDDTAIIEITDAIMRVRVDEQVVQRNSVSSAITNGTFDANITSWTDADEAGATSAWATGGHASLTGTRYNAAILRQQVTVAAADKDVQHGLKIVVERGNLTLKVGSSAGGTDYIGETVLGPGEHSLAFTPTGDFHVELSNRAQAATLVDSVAVEAAGDMTLTAPWKSLDLPNLRWDQSGDIVYVACDGHQQRKIERRGTKSWSLVEYQPEDGPFRPENITTLSMTAAALTGDTTLTASRAYFDSKHVGAIFRLTSIGQKVSVAVTAEAQWSSSIRIVGADNSRIFVINISGTWVATVTLQRSTDDATWTDVTTYTTNQTNVNYDDALDNQIIYYRIGVDTGDFTSGTATCTLTYSGGGITGHCRVTSHTSTTVVNIAVLDHIGQTTATELWAEGLWSDYRGWPTAVAFHEGRLVWAGRDWLALSVSDAYESFSEDVTGDSGPIIRSIGSGAIDFVNWLLPLQRLIVGTQGAEVSARSTSLDELLTPTNYNAKPASTQGSDRIAAVKVDKRGVFVQRSGLKLYELNLDLGSVDYEAIDLSVLVPDIGDPGFVHIEVQRQPETRIHCLRDDGTVAVLLHLPAEDVKAWIEVETAATAAGGGTIEDILVLPAWQEDVVYYCVRRIVDGSVKRYLEKFALESECIGGTYNCNADCFAMFINNPASATISGLDHLEGESVIVWADGICLADADGDIETFTVSGGAITATHEGASYSATKGIVGLAHRARFKSGTLPFAIGNLGTALSQRQRVANIALLLQNVHPQGIRFGRDFDNMDNLPKVIDGATQDPDTMIASYVQPAVTFPGDTSVDARLCLEANAPRPVTVKAAVLGIATHETPP